MPKKEFAIFAVILTCLYGAFVWVTTSKQQHGPHPKKNALEFTGKELKNREDAASMEQKASSYSELSFITNSAQGGGRVVLRYTTKDDRAIPIPPGITVTLNNKLTKAVCSRDEKRYVVLFHVNDWWYKIVKQDESGTWIVEKEQSEKAEENKEGDLERALESLVN